MNITQKLKLQWRYKMNQQLPVFNIDDALTRNIVGGIASKALHRVLAIGLEITQTKPLHLYKEDVSLAIHRIGKKSQNQYRVIIANVQHGTTYIASDIAVKGATESISTLSTSMEELQKALNNMPLVSNIEYMVGNLTDSYIQELADIERVKREKEKSGK